MKIYIRFGDVPKDEKCRIHRGNEIIGHEDGVSVWNAVLLEDGYHLVAPLHGNTCTYTDFISHAFPEEWYPKPLPDFKIYVVTGDEVGKGSDGEPLLKNVKILKQLSSNYFKYGDNSNYTIKGIDKSQPIKKTQKLIKEEVEIIE